ncbi:MAG: hypothetical protein BRC44_07880 [Cyanobacteria bacterium QS_4_48_99]|nr:MAG: hypothetical protein BRC44_07880 [Cyanobacteria bacterium QS_4_48_99]
MTNAASANTSHPWGWDFFTPQPHQDTDLFKQFSLIPGLKEFLMLRQVHALEHATVWVLSETAREPSQIPDTSKRPSAINPPQADNEALGGLSTDQGFYLYGQVNPVHLQRAVCLALGRFQAGEWDLAVHPRCGTNVSVALMLAAGMSLGTHLLLPRSPLEQLLGLGLATTTATQLAPDLGKVAQKYLTTSIPFNLKLVDILETSDFWGNPAHFVLVRWSALQ